MKKLAIKLFLLLMSSCSYNSETSKFPNFEIIMKSVDKECNDVRTTYFFENLKTTDFEFKLANLIDSLFPEGNISEISFSGGLIIFDSDNLLLNLVDNESNKYTFRYLNTYKQFMFLTKESNYSSINQDGFNCIKECENDCQSISILLKKLKDSFEVIEVSYW